MPTVNEAAHDALVRHQVAVLRWGSTFSQRRALKLLERADIDLIQRISARLETISRRGLDPGPATTRRLQEMLVEIRVQARELREALSAEFRAGIEELAPTVAAATADRIDRSVSLEGLSIRPASDLIVAAATSRPFQGRLLRDWMKEMERGRVRRTFQAIQLGIVEGQTNDQIVRALRGTRAARFRDGILEGSRRGLDALVRTTVTHVAAVARDKVYQANSDIIEELRWTATLDGRTTAICRGRDGKTYPLDTGPRPPAHINCRSVMTPVLRSWDELAGPNSLHRGRGSTSLDQLMRRNLANQGKSASEIKRIVNGTRSSMTGQVPGDLTYGEWLRRQPIAFQNDVLGRTKGRLFRSGELPVDRFVDLRTGREFTLSDLRRREPAAWGRAGLSSD